MRSPRLHSRLAAGAVAAFVVLAPLASAQDLKPNERSAPCQCQAPCPSPSPGSPRPKFADHSPAAQLDEGDEIAALEAIRVALSEVGDGATYLWYRQNGRLNGMVQPTASFKDRNGRVCRHLILALSAGALTGRVEGIACRAADGRWALEG
jgi:hypothetical protein